MIIDCEWSCLFSSKQKCKQSLTLPEAILIAREGADADKSDTLKVWYDAPHRSVANPTRAQPNVDYRGSGIHSLPADWLEPGDFITTDWRLTARSRIECDKGHRLCVSMSTPTKRISELQGIYNKKKVVEKLHTEP